MSVFSRKTVFVLFIAAMAFLITGAVAAQPWQETYTEGIRVEQILYGRVGIGTTRLTLHATKFVDGWSRYTEISINAVRYAGDGTETFCCIRGIIDDTVILPGDPDELEVSNDLGWGGLNGVVWVQETVETCPNYSNCVTSVRAVPVRIQLSLLPDAQVQFNGTRYERGQDFSSWRPGLEDFYSIVRGKVDFPQGQDFEFGTVPPNQYRPEYGWTFSSREPFPDE
jgi:hypothetical protein